MNEETNMHLRTIVKQLDYLIKIVYANTDKKDLCNHLAMEDTGQFFVTSSTALNNVTVKIVRCISCGAEFQQKVK